MWRGIRSVLRLKFNSTRRSVTLFPIFSIFSHSPDYSVPRVGSRHQSTPRGACNVCCRWWLIAKRISNVAGPSSSITSTRRHDRYHNAVNLQLQFVTFVKPWQPGRPGRAGRPGRPASFSRWMWSTKHNLRCSCFELRDSTWFVRKVMHPWRCIRWRMHYWDLKHNEWLRGKICLASVAYMAGQRQMFWDFCENWLWSQS